jgi:5-methylcytosine-specific restriction protein A
MLDESKVKRGLATTRVTGNSLYAAMKRFERSNPRLCAECLRQGRVRYGDELEHIVPLWQGGAESDSNREWICTEDHKIKTAREASERRSS